MQSQEELFHLWLLFKIELTLSEDNLQSLEIPSFCSDRCSRRISAVRNGMAHNNETNGTVYEAKGRECTSAQDSPTSEISGQDLSQGFQAAERKTGSGSFSRSSSCLKPCLAAES